MNLLNISLVIGLSIVLICSIMMTCKFLGFRRAQKRYMKEMEKRKYEMDILSLKMDKIKLNNTGVSIDKNIESLIEDHNTASNAISWRDIYA